MQSAFSCYLYAHTHSPSFLLAYLPFSVVVNMVNMKPSASSSSSISTFWSSARRRKTFPAENLSCSSNLNSSDDGLLRHLGLLDLLLIGIGSSIGAGIFVVTGTVTRETGPAVIISFIIAGIVSAFNALCYAELACRFPAVVGGAYLYSYTAFNELTAFLVFGHMMVDNHISSATMARSLASYIVSFLDIFPYFHGQLPSWLGDGDNQFFGGFISFNLLAPVLLILLTTILCYGVRESSAVNSFMTITKVFIVIVVILCGSFEIDVSNWSPFAPRGYKAVVTGATVVFFAYIGFDAVANSAEESKRPQRDLPLGILGSLLVTTVLYVAICLVLTGMVPYQTLSEDSPITDAFNAKGLKYVSVFITIGACAGLLTVLLIGLYIMSRYYLGVGRDGLVPRCFAKVHHTRHTPIHSQVFICIVTVVLAGLFNVHMLSHILSVGTLTGYSVVSAGLVALRWKDKLANQEPGRRLSTRKQGIICLSVIALCGFSTGLCYRFSASIILWVLSILIAIIAAVALHFRHVYVDPPGFSCPGVPYVPAVCIFFNIFLFAQLHHEAWYRFVIVTILLLGGYAFYGQHNAHLGRPYDPIGYHAIPSEEA